LNQNKTKKEAVVNVASNTFDIKARKRNEANQKQKNGSEILDSSPIPASSFDPSPS
jgi:hypothetical protein